MASCYSLLHLALVLLYHVRVGVAGAERRVAGNQWVHPAAWHASSPSSQLRQELSGSLVDGALVWKQMPEEESGIEHDFYLICPVTAVRAAAPLHCTRMKMPKHAHVCLARIHVSVRMHVADDCAR